MHDSRTSDSICIFIYVCLFNSTFLIFGNATFERYLQKYIADSSESCRYLKIISNQANKNRIIPFSTCKIESTRRSHSLKDLLFGISYIAFFVIKVFIILKIWDFLIIRIILLMTILCELHELSFSIFIKISKKLKPDQLIF
jgi:hypothetical protein